MITLGQILEETRTLSDPEFEGKKQALLDRWGQAMRSAMGRTAPAQ